MAHLLIVRGLPGSGKTTFGRQAAADMDAVHFEADQFMVDGKGNYKFDPSKLRYAHESCRAGIFGALSQGKDAVVSNTFTQRWEVEPYVQYCLANHHNYTIVTCNGDYGNIHGVPADKVAQMRERWEDFE